MPPSSLGDHASSSGSTFLRRRALRLAAVLLATDLGGDAADWPPLGEATTKSSSSSESLSAASKPSRNSPHASHTPAPGTFTNVHSPQFQGAAGFLRGARDGAPGRCFAPVARFAGARLRPATLSRRPAPSPSGCHSSSSESRARRFLARPEGDLRDDDAATLGAVAALSADGLRAGDGALARRSPAGTQSSSSSCSLSSDDALPAAPAPAPAPALPRALEAARFRPAAARCRRRFSSADVPARLPASPLTAGRVPRARVGPNHDFTEEATREPTDEIQLGGSAPAAPSASGMADDGGTHSSCESAADALCRRRGGGEGAATAAAPAPAPAPAPSPALLAALARLGLALAAAAAAPLAASTARASRSLPLAPSTSSPRVNSC
mmetsp:Transcript_15997/g.55859  ORF Transcript_15997/g.55859 Transcript_15997/m.55859 type:complete len:382 (-) Transcript_15997:366-1511(-)